MDPGSVIAALVGAALVATPRVRRRKTLPDKLPEHPWRRRMIAFVKAWPGSQLKDICQDLDVNRGTATHHLRLLEDAGILEGLEGGHAHYFFPAGTPEPRKRQLALLRRDQMLEIALRVHAEPGIIQKELLRGLTLSRKALRAYLHRLTEEGLLIEESAAQTRRYYPTVTLHEILDDLPP